MEEGHGPPLLLVKVGGIARKARIFGFSERLETRGTGFMKGWRKVDLQFRVSMVFHQ